LETSASYLPALGQGSRTGVSLADYQAIYQSDPFYNWMGLDAPLMYAAHKAAGGMTSVYRQIGIGCERVFRQILQDKLALSPEEARWTYLTPASTGKPRELSLDGRIDLAHVREPSNEARIREWMNSAASLLLITLARQTALSGVVFEVRQGYKSKDSKRQNADILNAASAYAHQYLPVLFVWSTQIDPTIVERYTQARWLILIGSIEGDATASTYTFCREVLEYDLAAFLERNAPRLRTAVARVLSALLEV
ncbi:MAG: hypothetical protein ACRDID_23315, partial [Ktedonobacterales bacterium]